jgi:hypothetical protein
MSQDTLKPLVVRRRPAATMIGCGTSWLAPSRIAKRRPSVMPGRRPSILAAQRRLGEPFREPQRVGRADCEPYRPAAGLHLHQ